MEKPGLPEQNVNRSGNYSDVQNSARTRSNSGSNSPSFGRFKSSNDNANNFGSDNSRSNASNNNMSSSLNNNNNNNNSNSGGVSSSLSSSRVGALVAVALTTVRAVMLSRV